MSTRARGDLVGARDRGGEEIYKTLCQACHLADGTGRIGPSLIGDNPKRSRTGSDRGRFEIIYAGGAGAMQAFGQRLDQDQILQVMAYLEVLRDEAEQSRRGAPSSARGGLACSVLL